MIVVTTKTNLWKLSTFILKQNNSENTRPRLIENSVRAKSSHHHYPSSCPELFCKKDVLRNFAKFTGKHLCQSLWICEFCDISTNTFSYRTPLVAASVFWLDTPPLKEKVYILSRGKDSKWKNSRDRNVKGFWKRRIRKHSKKFERGEGRKVFF